METVEERDGTKETSISPQDNKIDKVGALLLQVSQSIFSTNKVVILDSGFCVLYAIIDLQKQGVFSSALLTP